MMYGRDQHIIYGRAVDDGKTKQCHQIFGVTSAKDNNLNTLHYSVFRPSGKLDVDKAFLENVCDVLTDKKGLLTLAGRQKANERFGQLMSKIKTDKKSYFVLDKPSPAITFDIGFNNGFNVESIDFRLTTATMVEKINSDVANDNILLDEPDHELKMWHDLIAYQKYDGIPDFSLSFEEITDRTTRLIQKYMCDYTVRNKLACIFKVLPKAIGFREYDGKCTYGSTLAFEEQIKMNGADSSRAVLPATANREAIDAINLSSLAEFKSTGNNLYTSDLLDAVINYKMVRLAA